jgi:hypothetical protein
VRRESFVGAVTVREQDELEPPSFLRN